MALGRVRITTVILSRQGVWKGVRTNRPYFFFSFSGGKTRFMVGVPLMAVTFLYRFFKFWFVGGFYMFIFCPRRQKTNQKNAAQGKEGLKNPPRAYAIKKDTGGFLQHPLSLKDPSHLRASHGQNYVRFKTWIALYDKAYLHKLDNLTSASAKPTEGVFPKRGRCWA